MVAKSISLVTSGEFSHDDGDPVVTEMKNFEDLLKRLDLLEEQERIDDELVEEGLVHFFFIFPLLIKEVISHKGKESAFCVDFLS